MSEPNYKLRDWIPLDKLNLEIIASEPRAINVIEQNLHKFDDEWISNPSALHLIESKNYPRYMLVELCDNPNPRAIEMIKTHGGLVRQWHLLSANPGALSLLLENFDKINWNWFSKNPNPDAIPILQQNLHQNVNWYYISTNPNAYPIIKDNLDKINWNLLCRNKDPRVIKILEKNPNKICWEFLSANPAAIHLIKKNINKINWYGISANPAAIDLIEKNIDKISIENLASNPAAIHIIEKHIHKYYGNYSYDFWTNLSFNPEIFILDDQVNTGLRRSLRIKEQNDCELQSASKKSRKA